MGTFLFFVIFPDPPVSEDKSEQDLNDVNDFPYPVSIATSDRTPPHRPGLVPTYPR